jgi:hypothetical protein
VRKLWKVSFDFEMIVVAETMDDAASVAESHARDEIENAGVGPIEELQSIAEIPVDWLDSIPYGELANDDTCSQIQMMTEDECIVNGTPMVPKSCPTCGKKCPGGATCKCPDMKCPCWHKPIRELL